MTNIKTSIEWTTITWNPWTGCSKVSPGCKYCYAERLAQRYKIGFSVRLWPERWGDPLKWREPKLVFVNSMSDFWHEEVSDEARVECLKTMEKARHHVFQVLTKRPEGMIRFYEKYPEFFGYDKRHLWLGVSVENALYTNRIRLLTKIPASVHFVSFEPLLGPVPEWPTDDVEWVIVGGESGPHLMDSNVCRARSLVYRDGSRWLPKPEAVEWVRMVRDRAKQAGVAFFFKQWGGPTPASGGRLLDGKEWLEMPTVEAKKILDMKGLGPKGSGSKGSGGFSLSARELRPVHG